MKISTNPIGNYSTALIQKNTQGVSKSSSVQTEKLQAPQASLTSKEKQFFVNMYPNNSNEVMDYHFYEKSGKMSGVSLGTIIDRRG